MRVASGRISPEALAALARSRDVTAQVRAVAERIRKEAGALAPIKTGNLHRNILVEESIVDGEVVYRVGWGPAAWYGSLVELGTADTPAQPHLRPAADKVNRALGR